MNQAITFIINPAAGFGKTKKKLKPLIKQIRAHNKKANILITRHPLHAIGLTKKAINSGSERLVVIGGDGTLNEVVNGYFDGDGKAHNENVSISIIPSGTGTDFYRSIEIKDDFKETLDFAINGIPKLTDVGFVEAHDANGNTISRYFINVSSIGISGIVAGFMKTVTKMFGAQGAYFIATFQALRIFSPPTLRITENGLTQTIKDCSLISFANGKFFGSGMKIAPNAKLDDGLLDIITIENLRVSSYGILS